MLDSNLVRQFGGEKFCPSPRSIALNTNDEFHDNEEAGDAHMVDPALQQFSYAFTASCLL